MLGAVVGMILGTVASMKAGRVAHSVTCIMAEVVFDMALTKVNVPMGQMHFL